MRDDRRKPGRKDRRRREQMEVPKTFAEDEMNLLSVNSLWTPEDLLSQEGVFFLKDIVKILDLDVQKTKRKANEIVAGGKDSWEVMGVKKVWSHWMVRMKIFAPYYRNQLVPRTRRIQKEWDGNDLIKQEGIFLLSEVCKLIPFTTHQLRYQAKRNPRAKEEFGIWKDPELNAFVVDMARFGPWIRKLWGSLSE